MADRSPQLPAALPPPQDLSPMMPGVLADGDEIPEHLLCRGMPVWLLHRQRDGSFHRRPETIYDVSDPGSELALVAVTIGEIKVETYLPYGLHRVRFRRPEP